MDHVGNTLAIKHLRHAMETKGRVLLTGPTGCGKSSLVHAIATEKDFDVIELHSDSCATMKQAQDLVTEACRSNTIQSYFSPRRRLLWIDDADLIASQLTRFPAALAEWLAAPWAASLCIICAATSTAKLGDSVKALTPVKLTRPSQHDCFVYFTNYCEKNGVNIDPAHLLEMIAAHSNDIRSIHMNLVETVNTNAARPDDEPAHIGISTFRTAFQDASVFEAQDRLLRHPQTLASVKDLLYGDSKMICWTIQENIGLEFQHYRRSLSAVEATRAMMGVLDAFATAEVMDQAANAAMNWDLVPYAYIEMLGRTMHILHDIPRATGLGHVGFVFTNVMNKASQRAQLLRKKAEWASEHSLAGDEQQLAGMQAIGMLLKAHVAKKKAAPAEVAEFTKLDTDIGCRFAADFGVMTASQCSAWKKHKKASA